MNNKNRLTPKLVIMLALVVIVVVCICIAFYFSMQRSSAKGETNSIFMVLQPILFGIVGAFLVNPIMKAYERQILKRRLPKAKDKDHEQRIRRSSRYWAIAGGLTTFLLIVIGIIALVVPQLVLNIASLVKTVPGQVAQFTSDFRNFMNNSKESEQISELIQNGAQMMQEYLKDELLPKLVTYLTIFTSGVMVALKILLNSIIGLMVAVYILADKEKFKGQGKKIAYALFKPGTANEVIKTFRKANEIFFGFVVGKIIDSLIIGLIAFVVLWILRMPYPVLLASIIGITNVIPVFGPFIGGIPCAVLVFLANPVQAIYFVIFIIILQQVDGNIIGPNILENTTGLSSFWVIFAILVGGGFFGVPGMLLGVPVFGVIYYLLRKLFSWKLKKRNLPEETKEYILAERIEPDTNEIIYMEENDERKKKIKFGFFQRRK